MPKSSPAPPAAPPLPLAEAARRFDFAAHNLTAAQARLRRCRAAYNETRAELQRSSRAANKPVGER